MLGRIRFAIAKRIAPIAAPRHHNVIARLGITTQESHRLMEMDRTGH